MSDYKTPYSNVSRDYIDTDVKNNKIDEGRYNRSKDREKQFNDNWLENEVDINEVVTKFMPDESKIEAYTESGVKYYYEDDNYQIRCDKVAGYLRIYDKKNHRFLKLDGTPSKEQKETHFKIKKKGQK